MNQISIIEKLTPAEIYSEKNVDQILLKIKEEASAFQPNTETLNGRKEIASLAYKISQSKTFMDDCGKKLGEEAKKTLDTINSERKKVRDFLDELKDQVRKPLTDWEAKEEERKKAVKNNLISIENLGDSISNNWLYKTIDEIEGAVETIELAKELNWHEFKEDAEKAIQIAEAKINSSLELKKLHDEQHAELKKLREEKEERDRAEAERLEIERNQAWIKAQQEEKAKQQELAKREEAEREQKRIAREKQLALEKEAAIEYEKQMSEKRLKEAAEKAEKEKQQAVERERLRAEQQKKLELEAEQKRQANIKHRTKINNEVLKALSDQGLSEEIGKKVITAIVSGLIPYTKINY